MFILPRLQIIVFILILMAGMEWGGAPGVILAAVIGVFIASKVPSFSESSKEKEGNGNNTSSAEREEDFRFSLLLLCAL
ncbi:MAG: hypothetical protein LPK80_06820, partial [Bacteroidota bacterium]|nr:hypothetical protein [Bacteroidota bacterium]